MSSLLIGRENKNPNFDPSANKKTRKSSKQRSSTQFASLRRILRNRGKDYKRFFLDLLKKLLNMGESSSSTSWNSQNNTEDDRMIALMLSEEYSKLDGAVGRRLANLAPVAHVPRINSYIPKFSDATLDHQRLLQRLNVYGLCELKVSGDGNCQFRALSDQLYRSSEYHKQLRREVVKQLKDNRSVYESYVPMKYKKYYKKMAKLGEWGDHITLQAAADRFAAKICLLTSFRETCFIEIMPQHQAPKRVLWLSFWSEVHYNSLYDNQVAPVQQKPKRKHWLF